MLGPDARDKQDVKTNLSREGTKLRKTSKNGGVIGMWMEDNDSEQTELW